MLSDEMPWAGNKTPETLGGSPVSFMLYVPDVDTAFSHAIEAGATVVRPVSDQFYGDRTGTVRDPFGYQWLLGTHVEDVSLEEMQRRMANGKPHQPDPKHLTATMEAVKYITLLVAAATLFATACAPSESSDQRHHEANTPAGKVGQVAHKASVQLDKAGRVVGRELGHAAHDAREGWNEDAQKHKSSGSK